MLLGLESIRKTTTRLTRWVFFVGQVSVELARAQDNKTPGNTINKTSMLTSGPADLKDYIYDSPRWANRFVETSNSACRPPISVKAKAAQRLSAQQRKRK